MAEKKLNGSQLRIMELERLNFEYQKEILVLRKEVKDLKAKIEDVENK